MMKLILQYLIDIDHFQKLQNRLNEYTHSLLLS